MATTPNDAPSNEQEHPQARQWLWVLTAPLTIHRDSILVLEDDSGEYVPIFADKQEADHFLKLLDEKASKRYVVQAMHLFDLQKFAREKGFSLTTLTSAGQVIKRWSPLDQAEN
jgi:hypothetical protein